ncbi:Cyclin-dependent kinase-like 2 [Oryzias melastigma]|uniref:Cyclin-dependent kinase-like 2 n=1 Tax=Oryzias melastigma TaxID=30732 RepID=A0A834CAB6_ORYME|nr:Cyclin-dependent kinase-like 2 [Oryzias melastigma]
MERYESLGPVGEGSYGTVLKCRHRESGRLVAIKKFIDSDDDKTVKKIALREIKLLRQLRHDNLVNLLEVWKRRHRWYLVFEFVDRTLLNDLEQNPSGLDLDTARQYLYQILRATDFCHQQNVIHRDIKPENILISHTGVVKLCDFGFARTMTSPPESAVYTDYVATRWYRAPELLVGDIKYGKPVDVWAVGCLIIEMLTSQPLFPGESDLDQIHHIVRCFGNLMTHHQELFYRNPVFSGVKLPEEFRECLTAAAIPNNARSRNQSSSDPKTSTRGFDLHETTDSRDFPPPPTPSSTPLLLTPSPTCPTSVFGISNNPDCDHLRPGIYNLRSADIPRDHIQPVDPLPSSYATTSVLHQASEDFSSNHRNLGNCSATLAKNQSQGNFPELGAQRCRNFEEETVSAFL